jgi:RHS repeat-associated protein
VTVFSSLPLNFTKSTGLADRGKIEEIGVSRAPMKLASTRIGVTGVAKNLTTNRYYYQDASGSTTHLASSTGAILEWYRYDLQGTPVFYNASNTQINATAYGVRHLFTGQQWYNEIGLYDLRNRFYSPDMGRFLQADPSGFNGDAGNLYRYCGNNPLTRSDASGLFLYRNGGVRKFDRGGGGDWGDRIDGITKAGDGTSLPSFGMTGVDTSDLSPTDRYQFENNDGQGFVNAGGYIQRAPGVVGFERGEPIFSSTPLGGGGLATNTYLSVATQVSGGSNPDGNTSVPPILHAIGDIIGKIWALPNTVLGLAVGIASLPFGGEIHFGNNAIQFTNVPFGHGGALTLGNVELFHTGTAPTSTATRYDGGPGLVPIGPHEQAHTNQNQLLGPFFLPFYLLNGGISPRNPLENAADNFAQGLGSWWPHG